MPKVINTRKENAAALWKLLSHGPHFSTILCGREFTQEEASREYQMWARSWILAEVARLVPELRDKVDDFGNIKE